MGWSGGADIMRDIIVELQEVEINVKKRSRVYAVLIRAFVSADWSTRTDCLDLDPAFDAAMRQLYPDWFSEEDEP